MEVVKEFENLTDFPAERCLQVNTCGVRRAIENESPILRSKGRGDFHLLYIKSGWITVEDGGSDVRVFEGKCVVYRPGERQLYSFSTKGNPIAYYVYFTGNAADETMKYVALHNSVIFDINERTVFESLFHQLIKVFTEHKLMHDVEENSILLQIIAVLAQSSSKNVNPIRSEVLFMYRYIREHFLEPITLSECAAQAHLSIGRVAHLFTETFGIAPYKFILQLRIDHAKALLLFSSMTVSEVSKCSGFDDPSYFGRLFRQYTGFSLTDYRNRNSQKDV